MKMLGRKAELRFAQFGLVVAIWSVALTTIVLGQTPSPSTLNNGGGASVAGPVSLMSNREFWLSLIILVFGIIIILIEYMLLRTVVHNKTEEIARTYTVTLIIIGTLVLISSGFTNEQIAPALGLFGTIAGYLLGKAEGGSRKGGSDGSTPP